MILRAEQPEDFAAIHGVVKRAFAAAPHSDGNEHHLVDALRQGAAYIPELSLIAVIDEKIVGHIMFTKLQIGKHMALALAPLSVLPEYQKQGIGTALIQAGHKIAAELGYSYSVVLGSEAYYPRFGYQPALSLGIQAPFDVPSENFMACQLTAAAPKVAGTVRYAPEFGIA